MQLSIYKKLTFHDLISFFMSWIFSSLLFSLVEEVGEINVDVSQLQNRVADSHASYKGLVRRQLDLEDDIQVKANTLFIDEVQCMGLRESISLPTF